MPRIHISLTRAYHTMLINSLLNIFNWHSPRRTERTMSVEQEHQDAPMEEVNEVINLEHGNEVELATAVEMVEGFRTPKEKAPLNETFTCAVLLRPEVPKFDEVCSTGLAHDLLSQDVDPQVGVFLATDTQSIKSQNTDPNEELYLGSKNVILPQGTDPQYTGSKDVISDHRTLPQRVEHQDADLEEFCSATEEDSLPQMANPHYVNPQVAVLHDKDPQFADPEDDNHIAGIFLGPPEVTIPQEANLQYVVSKDAAVESMDLQNVDLCEGIYSTHTEELPPQDTGLREEICLLPPEKILPKEAVCHEEIRSTAAEEESELSRTFTRRTAVPKDISPIPDNSMRTPPAPAATPAQDGTNPNPRTNVRSNRQKTMTMDPSGTHELRRLFADARQTGISLDDLETKMVDLFRTKDAEMNGRLAKAMEQVERHEKHECRNDEANLMVYRALVAEYKMMLEELTSGAYIHVGRLEEYGYSKGAKCGSNCKASVERDQMKSELDSLHEDYSKLYDSYRRLRGVAEDQKQEYAALHEKYVERVEEIKRLQGKLMRLREDAQNKLEMASKDMADCIRDRDESLVGLKLKVRQLEAELSSALKELEIKKGEVTELRDICNTLMSQVEPGSDAEQ